MNRHARGLPVSWPLRAWFGAELFFAVAATLSVAVDPTQSQHAFAWPIKPPVMAALIGAFYLALMPVMLLALLVRRWHMLRVFVLPGALFTLTELCVTLMHWDRFAVGTPAFAIWLASYLLPPPVFLACWWWHQARERSHAAAPGIAGPEAAPLGRLQRTALIVLGALLTLEALIALVWPGWFTSSAPWPLSPLNARALAGYLGLLGLLMLSMAHENHRDRVRLVSPFLALLLPVVVVQLNRFPDQVDWRHPRIAISALLLGAVCALGLSLARGSWRRVLRD